MRWRTPDGSVSTSYPATTAVPEVGGSRVASTRRLVVFPAPFGPRNATTEPASMSRSRPRTASTVSPLARKLRVSPRV